MDAPNSTPDKILNDPVVFFRTFMEKVNWQRVTVLIILISAFVVRVNGLRSEPFYFHPVKQYRSAMIARALYYNSLPDSSVPEWKREVANANLRDIGILQPPLQSVIAATMYRIIGGEALWLPRLFSALSWIIGSIFLYLLACYLVPRDAAVFSLSFYLLLPFTVPASQSFQIDPLMIAFTIAGMYLIFRQNQKRSKGSLLWAAGVTSIAIILKPISLFILLPGFIGLELSQKGLRNFLFDKNVITFMVTSLAPSIVYYSYGIFFSDGALHLQAVKSFIPIYFTEFRFWDGWQKRIRLVMGFTYFIGGMLGALLYSGRKRTFLLSLWIGYFLMCLAFNYTISTHDYYHLILIPIVALSLGSLAVLVLTKMKRTGESFIWKISYAVVLTIAVILGAGTSIQFERKNHLSNQQILMAQEIGNVIDHSKKTLYLAPEQGHSLLYYGEFSGLYWPYGYDIRDERLWLGNYTDIQQRFENMQSVNGAEYFIVADKDEFADQPDLRAFISENFPILVSTNNYIIYDIH